MPEDPTVEAETKAEAEEKKFVAESSKRTTVLKKLSEGPAEPSDIASGQPVSTSNAQSATEELHERGLVEQLVTDDTQAYGLTAEGENVLFLLKRSGEA